MRAEGVGHTATLNRRENALWEHRILSAEVDRWTFNVWFMLEMDLKGQVASSQLNPSNAAIWVVSQGRCAPKQHR